MSKNVSGFTQFLNDFGIRAFDELAARRAVAEPDSSEEPSPLDRLATRWSALNPAEKEEVVKRLLLAGSAVGIAAAPAIARARRAAKTRKAKSRAKKAPLNATVPEKPIRKRDAAKSDKKKDDQAKKEKKKQKKLMKEEKKQQKKEEKRKKKDQKKER